MYPLFRMRIGRASIGIALSLAMVLIVAPAHAASKNSTPPESTSKVKKVLLYNKIGGWQAVDGIANVKKYLASLSQTKGFVLDTLSNDTSITFEFLMQYQVIVWNNNTNGVASVPLASARKAIVDYVNQGGGWFLVGLAGDHANSWADLGAMLGTSFAYWTSGGSATMQVDSSALVHPELRFVVESLPHGIGLNDTWMSFRNTVRGLPGVTVLYTAQGPKSVLAPMADGRGDHVYGWARTLEKGKLLYCPPGWSSYQPSPLAQSDSAVAKLYWNSMRWLAGDFQNGCTDPTSPLFNPEARVDDGSCGSIALLRDRPIRGQGEYRRAQHSIALTASETTLLPSLAPSLINAENILNRDIRGKWITNSRYVPSKLEGLNHEK